MGYGFIISRFAFDVWKRSKAGLLRIKVTLCSRRHSPATCLYSIVTCSCGLCGVIWGISNAVFTNERTMAMDGEADSAPSAEIE